MVLHRWMIKSLLVLVIAMLVVLPPSLVQSYRVSHDNEEELVDTSVEDQQPSQHRFQQDSKKLQAALKIVKAYLEYQIDEIDSFIKKDDSRILNALVDKRQLKSQGILERLKNKMQHDLNKYGWDK